MFLLAQFHVSQIDLFGQTSDVGLKSKIPRKNIQKVEMKISFVLFSSALAWFSGEPLPRDADLWETFQLRTDQLYRDAIEGLLKNNFRESKLK